MTANTSHQDVVEAALVLLERMALPPADLATGHDPELDTLILRLHTETACRRGGALALRPRDLDPDQGLILHGAGKGRDGPLAAGLPYLDGSSGGHGRERHTPPAASPDR